MPQVLPLRVVTRYYRDHVELVDGFARFAVGERVRTGELGWLGTIEALYGPGPEFTQFVVRFDNGLAQVLEDHKLQCQPSHPVVQAVAARFELPSEFVANVLNDTPEAMRDRDRYCAPSNGVAPEAACPRYSRFTPKLQSWPPDPRDSYIDYLDVVDPLDVEPAEPEESIRRHETYRRYVEWYRAGHEPPYPAVFEQFRGGKQCWIGANRRRILAAREAEVGELTVWKGRWNREKELPLKYGDILAAALQLPPSELALAA